MVFFAFAILLICRE